jgi:hypothetical protein
VGEEVRMLIEHNSYSFLTGKDPFVEIREVDASEDRYTGEFAFEPHHEGFIGIPHGGLPMGLCVDLWRRTRVPHYPVDIRFKFGGSGIGIGEQATLAVDRGPEDQGPSLMVRITKDNDKTPYLSAWMRSSDSGRSERRVPTQPSEDHRLLPYYRNCFVCGHHRTTKGLQRRFRLHRSNGSHVVTTPWGLNGEDFDRAEMFLIDKDEIHPAVLMSIFDENTAWGGFMDTRTAGLSVRLEIRLLRPVARTEPLIFVGRPAGIRGNPKAPRFFKGEGEILSLRDPQDPEPVAYGNGEWVILTSYTEQIKNNLLPEGDGAWIFSADDCQV